MKVLGIIAEYNPFHNGHKYHLETAKKLTGADYVVVIMSGNFTEQGNIAIYDKFTRSKLAIQNGADMVIELPAIFANSSAEYFSSSAVNILDKLGIIDYLCFGAETNNIKELDIVAQTYIDNESKIWEKIRLNLKDGYSLAKAREIALRDFLDNNLKDIVSKSNNILGIEYLKALKKLNSNISPYIVERNTVTHNDTNSSKGSMLASATYIRKEIYNGNIEDAKNYVPSSTFNIICNDKATFNEDIYNILRYKINSMSKDEIKNIFEITEGLENRIIKANNISSSYEELVKNIKSKRYVESKIRRILINILLDITKDAFIKSSSYVNLYAHILAVSENGKNLLPLLAKKSTIPVITSVNDKVLNSFGAPIKDLIHYDILSSNIYSIATKNSLNTDYTNKL